MTFVQKSELIQIRKHKPVHTYTHAHTYRTHTELVKTSPYWVIDMRLCTSAKHPFTRIQLTLERDQTQMCQQQDHTDELEVPCVLLKTVSPEKKNIFILS